MRATFREMSTPLSTKTLKSLEPNLVLDNEEIEVQVRFPRMASFSAPESKNA
jgi:hypothetical protein